MDLGIMINRGEKGFVKTHSDQGRDRKKSRSAKGKMSVKTQEPQGKESNKL